jgi:hypothetical protein
MAGKVEVGAVTCIGTEFSRQQPDESQLRPLRNPEALEQLLLGVFQGERDGIRGGSGQRAPRGLNGFSSKVLRIQPRIKSFRTGLCRRVGIESLGLRGNEELEGRKRKSEDREERGECGPSRQGLADNLFPL